MSETPTMVRPHVSGSPETPPDEVLLGRYRVLERRGSGGFGSVCSCWDLRLRRRVAIKRMPLLAEGGTTSTDEALAEAQHGARLAHPNIVAVHDFESDGSFAYLVMEYVDGLSLAELLARVEGGRLTDEECAHVLLSIARALEYAHDNHVLHLDIKPTNILIDRQGTVKLADFGMSSLSSAAGWGDARGGTVGYMPPEQIRGLLVDERADVFSLAVVTWQALTGENPFAAPTAEKSLDLIFRGPDRPLSDACPGLAGEPETALLSALRPLASERTTSATSFARGLARWLGDPQAGAESLAGLVAQADEEVVGRPRAERVPLWERFPRAEGILTRLACAASTLATTHIALMSTTALDGAVAGVAPLAAACAAAAWPPLGSLAGGLALALALATASPSPLALALAALVLGAVVAWWALVGRGEHLASVAMLLPCCLPSPTAGAALAGFALDPLPAAATGVAGHLLGSLFHLAASAGFDASTLVGALAAHWAAPSFWLLVAGSGACALVSSAVAMRGTVASGIVGQTLGAACLVACQLLSPGMENGGIWAYPDGEAIALALLLYVILCIATVLRGPLFWDQEGEEHEFSE